VPSNDGYTERAPIAFPYPALSRDGSANNGYQMICGKNGKSCSKGYQAFGGSFHTSLETYPLLARKSLAKTKLLCRIYEISEVV
jgi:hypothetical protein